MRVNLNKKRSLRVRNKLKKINTNRYRISVSKSLNNISAQIIDDNINKTVVSASSNEKKIRENKVKKTEMSTIIVETLAKRALEKKLPMSILIEVVSNITVNKTPCRCT